MYYALLPSPILTPDLLSGQGPHKPNVLYRDRDDDDMMIPLFVHVFPTTQLRQRESKVAVAPFQTTRTSPKSKKLDRKVKTLRIKLDSYERIYNTRQLYIPPKGVCIMQCNVLKRYGKGESILSVKGYYPHSL